jgi:pyruvate dehydrogenase (quinone)
LDLLSLFKDVAHEYVQTASDPSQIRHLIDRAVRIAHAEKTVTCVIIPNDLQTMDAVEVPPHEHFSVHTGVGHPRFSVVPTGEVLQDAARVLNEGNRVAMLIGAGAADASEEIVRIAGLLNAGIAKALLGKSVISDDYALTTGSIGFIGTTATEYMMRNCDTLLMVGTSFPYAEFLPEEGQARWVQIDVDGRMLSLRYPAEVNLVGDSFETLQRLIPLLHEKGGDEWKSTLMEQIRQWNMQEEELALRPATR